MKTCLNTRAGIVGYRLLQGAAKGLNIVGIPTVERVSCLVSISLNYTSIMRYHHTKSYLFTLSFKYLLTGGFPHIKDCLQETTGNRSSKSTSLCKKGDPSNQSMKIVSWASKIKTFPGF